MLRSSWTRRIHRRSPRDCAACSPTRISAHSFARRGSRGSRASLGRRPRAPRPVSCTAPQGSPGRLARPPMSDHVLVTGGAGFIGSHLVDALLAREGGAVTVLDKLTYAGSFANLTGHETDRRFRFVHGDVTDAATVESLVRDADRVVHAAAETHVDRSISGPAEFVMTNIVGTYTVLEACRE